MSIADNYCIVCVLAMRRPSVPTVNVSVRDFRQLKIERKTLNKWLMTMTQFSEQNLNKTRPSHEHGETKG